jgi:hypothetical protein
MSGTVLDTVGFVHTVVDAVDFTGKEDELGTNVVTTGPEPLAVGSVLTMQLQAYKDGVAWDLTGGSVTLKLLDPAGNPTSISGSIVGQGAQAPWTVTSPAGNWTRAWVAQDAGGTHLVSRPIVFAVTTSP